MERPKGIWGYTGWVQVIKSLFDLQQMDGVSNFLHVWKLTEVTSFLLVNKTSHKMTDFSLVESPKMLMSLFTRWIGTTTSQGKMINLWITNYPLLFYSGGNLISLKCYMWIYSIITKPLSGPCLFTPHILSK